VEQYFVAMRALLQEYIHGFYWIGYRAPVANPAFDWIDPQALGNSYTHWGVQQPLGMPEPNNLDAPENCVGANGTQALEDGAFGWSDERCTTPAQFVCKVLREWPGHPASTCRSRPAVGRAGAFGFWLLRSLPAALRCHPAGRLWVHALRFCWGDAALASTARGAASAAGRPPTGPAPAPLPPPQPPRRPSCTTPAPTPRSCTAR
jgi:hypothetical protein